MVAATAEVKHSVRPLVKDAPAGRELSDAGEPFLAHRTMKVWVEQLPRNVFYRVHPSVILNLKRLDRVEEEPRNTFRAIMKGTDRSFPISGREAVRLKRMLS